MKAKNTKKTPQQNDVQARPFLDELVLSVRDKKEQSRKDKISFYKKVYKVQQKAFAAEIKKSGRNKFSNYEYSTKEDILDGVKDAIKDSGLVITFDYKAPEYDEAKSKKGDILQTIKMTAYANVTDTDTGYSESYPMYGYSEDSQDKAIWKVYTGIQKYFFLKFFNLKDYDKDSEPENSDPRGQYAKKKKASASIVSSKSKEEQEIELLNLFKKKLESSPNTVNWDKAIEMFSKTQYKDEVIALQKEYEQKALDEEERKNEE